MRWLALRCSWGLSFDKLPPERFTDYDTWVVDRDGLYAAAVTAGAPQSADAVHTAISALPDADPWSICQGHDLLGLLRIGLQQVLGKLEPNKGVKDLAALLRAAFDEGELHRGAFGRSIRGWETANPPYRVLPHPPL